MKENVQKVEETEARQTITAKESFELAKDVYDIRTLIKKVYANRAIISRRLNVLSLIFGVAFSLVYITYAVFSALAGKLSLSFEIVSVALIAAYAAVVIGCIVVAACSANVKAKNIKRFKKFLKILNYIAKLLTVAISIACLVMSITSGSTGAAAIAVDTVMIIFAIIMAIVQTIMLLSGGVVGVVKWLLSPVKRKVRFSAVALEWYQLAADDNKDKKPQVRVSKKYIDDVGAVLDGTLLPALGKIYIGNVAPEDLLNALGGLSDELTPVGEGTIKSIFEYACDCGYISDNPCDKLNFSGDINDGEVQKKGIKSRIVNAGKKAGMSFIDNLISPDGK